MNKPFDQEIRYRLLRTLGENPNLTQRDMAKEMGISLGKINYCLSGLVKKGLIRIKRFKSSKNKIQYIYMLTPRGLDEKASLTLSFLKRKLMEYEEINGQIKALAQEVDEQRLDGFYQEDALDLLNKIP